MKVKAILLSLIVSLVLVAACYSEPTIVTAGTKEVCWTLPPTNLDGSVITDLAGVRIYYASCSDCQSDAQRFDIYDLTQICELYVNIPGWTSADIFFKVNAFDNVTPLPNEAPWSNQDTIKGTNTGEIPNGINTVTHQ